MLLARWLTVVSQKDLAPTLGLSASACEMLLVLKDHLALVEQRLSRPLFTKFWQRLATRLNTFLLNEVSFCITSSFSSFSFFFFFLFLFSFFFFFYCMWWFGCASDLQPSHHIDERQSKITGCTWRQERGQNPVCRDYVCKRINVLPKSQCRSLLGHTTARRLGLNSSVGVCRSTSVAIDVDCVAFSSKMSASVSQNMKDQILYTLLPALHRLLPVLGSCDFLFTQNVSNVSWLCSS